MNCLDPELWLLLEFAYFFQLLRFPPASLKHTRRWLWFKFQYVYLVLLSLTPETPSSGKLREHNLYHTSKNMVRVCVLDPMWPPHCWKKNAGDCTERNMDPYFSEYLASEQKQRGFSQQYDGVDWSNSDLPGSWEMLCSWRQSIKTRKTWLA